MWGKIFEIREAVDNSISIFLKNREISRAYLPTISKTVTPEYYTDSFSVSSDISTEKYFLQPSPEFYLKKLISQTQKSFYYLGPVYRAGEDMNTNIHIPEFEMLEWYKIGCEIKDFESMAIDLILNIIEIVKKREYYKCQIPKINRVSWNELFNSVGIEISDIRISVENKTQKSIREYLNEKDNFSDAFYKIYYTEIFDKTKDGNIWAISEFPKEMSALSVIDGDIAYRFEIYWNGVELINAYFEERNSERLLSFFEQSNEIRKLLNKQEISIDKEFINQCKDLPMLSGGSLGVDRLIFLLIKDFFKINSLKDMNFNFF